MPLSIVYKDLTKRITGLKKSFLSFDASRSTVPKNQDKLRSFKLLVHAELEWYVEKAASAVLAHCKNEWLGSKKIVPSLSCLILYSSVKFDGQGRREISDRIDYVITEYEKLLRKNNGIREKNLMQMMVPLGIKPLSLDTTWLSTIDSYGTSRGEIAHFSFSVHRALDQASELNDLDKVLEGLAKMDLALQKLLTRKVKFF